MQKVALVAASAVLIVHGLIHLMGTTVYLKLGKIEGLPYKTTLLNGRWDLGERGMRVFGALWVLPALGFVLGGVAVLAGWTSWLPMVTATTVFSLVLTVLDWQAAFAGAILNALILGLIWLGPIFLSRLTG